MKNIKILLIEDNRILRDGITSLIKKESDMSVVAAVAGSVNIVQTIEKYKPGIVLLGLGLPSQDNVHSIRVIKNHSSAIKIIIIGLIPLQENIFEFVRAGVSGFIMKNANDAEFINAIRSVHHGSKILPPPLTEALFSQIGEPPDGIAKPSASIESIRMTKREGEVIELIAGGFTNNEIAEKLNLSFYTVKSHVHHILNKLSLTTRVQISTYARLSSAHKPAIDIPSDISE